MEDFYLVWEGQPNIESPLDEDAHVLTKEFNEVMQNDMTHLVTWRAQRFSKVIAHYLADVLTNLQEVESSRLRRVGEGILRHFFGLEIISYEDAPVEALLAGIQSDDYGDKYLDQGGCLQLVTVNSCKSMSCSGQQFLKML